MAELLDLGKHCHLSICKQLDFTPFFCVVCENFYCSSHRFEHGCDTSKKYDPSTGSQSDSVLRPYVCSQNSCLNKEMTSIICPYCKLNYCLAHRFTVDHACTEYSQKNCDAQKKETTKKLEDIAEKMKEAGVVLEKPTTVTNAPPRPVKVLSASQQATADKIAAMRLKARMTNGKVASQGLIIFASGESVARTPVFVEKSWSVGKCWDSIRKTLNLNITQNPTLFKEGSKVPLDFSDIVSKVLKDMDVILITF